MRELFKNKRTRTIVLTVLASVMVISLCTLGLSMILKNRPGKAVADAATGYVGTDGKFDVPKAEGNLGTANNPFVVLEVVPGEDMAQFGYLVSGQEPVDFSKLDPTKDEDKVIIDQIKAKITANLSVSTVDYGTPYKVGFWKDIESLTTKYESKQNGTANQYGEYVYHDTANYDYELTLDVGSGEGGKTFVEDEDSTSYKYVKLTGANNQIGTDDTHGVGVEGKNDVSTPLPDGVGMNADELKVETDPDLYDAEGNLKLISDGKYRGTIWANRDDAAGVYSDEEYTKVNKNGVNMTLGTVGDSKSDNIPVTKSGTSNVKDTVDGGSVALGTTVARTGLGADANKLQAQSDFGGVYSMDYEYVGAGNGDYEYGVTKEGGDFYVEGDKNVTFFKLQKTGYFMDMGTNGTEKLYTENDKDTTNEYQYFQLVKAGAERIDGKDTYLFYTGESDYTKVLTAKIEKSYEYSMSYNGRTKNLTLIEAGKSGTRQDYYVRTSDNKYLYDNSGNLQTQNNYSTSDAYYKFYIDGDKLRPSSYGVHYVTINSSNNFAFASGDRSSYAGILTIVSENSNGYLTSANREGSNGNANQRFALEEETFEGKTYYRIYCKVGGQNYYYTGSDGVSPITLATSKYTATSETETINVVVFKSPDNTKTKTVYPKSAGNDTVGGNIVETFYLYTKDSKYKNALTYANNGTVGESTAPDSDANTKFYKKTFNGKEYYCPATDDNGGYDYLYLKNDGGFALQKPDAMPGEVESVEESTQYALITCDGISRLVQLDSSAGISGGRQYYYLTSAEDGFTGRISDNYITLKFYYDGTCFRVEDGRVLKPNDSFYQLDGGTVSVTVKFLTEAERSDYRILTNTGGFSTYRTVVKLVKDKWDSSTYNLYTAVSGFNKALYEKETVSGNGWNKRYSYTLENQNKSDVKNDAGYRFKISDGKFKSTHTNSSNYIAIYNSNGNISLGTSGATISELPVSTTHYFVITNGVYSVKVKAVETSSGSSEYYLYTGASYSDQIRIKQNGEYASGVYTDTSNRYIFKIETVGSKKYIKVKDTTKTKPYLYAKSATELSNTSMPSIPGSFSISTDTITTKELIGYQLFARTDEKQKIRPVYRYILNGNETRYLEVNDDGKFVQGNTAIYTTNDNQVFAFIKVDTNKYVIYTGHSGYTKVLTLDSTDQNARISEQLRDSGKKNRQEFIINNINDFINYQKITSSSVNRIWDVNSNALNNYGQEIILYGDNGGNNQKFKFALATPSPETLIGFYAKAGGHYKKITGAADVKYPQMVGAYTYTNTTSSEKKVKISANSLVYYVAAGSSLTLYLGDFDKTYGLGVNASVSSFDGPKFIENTTDKYGNHNSNKYVLTEIKGAYKYLFTIIPAAEHSGHYEWVGLPYDECYGAEKIVTDTSIYPEKVAVTSTTSDITPDEKKAKYHHLKSYISKEVWTLYEKGTTSQSDDAFKKYGIGLAYVDGDYSKGYAEIRYEFGGWYTDAECTVSYNPESIITRDTTLYAKWNCVDPVKDSFDVTFDANAYELDESGNIKMDAGVPVPDTSVPAESMPFFYGTGDAKNYTVSIRAGYTFSSPTAIPLRNGYIFEAWYDDAECKTKHNFATPVTKNITLYAGWKELDTTAYTVVFDANVTTVFDDANGSHVSGPAGAKANNIPETVSNYMANGRTTTYTDALQDTGKPVLVTSAGEDTGYLFDGWYYDSSCDEEYRFEFNRPFPSDAVLNKTDNKIYLYAKWVKADDECTITFNDNIPAGNPKAENVPEKLKVQYNTALTQDKYKENVSDKYTTKRESSAQKAMNEYDVRVITVTPKDLQNAENRKLINRANLIVINQTSSTEIRDLWRGKITYTAEDGTTKTVDDGSKFYANKVLFSKAGTAADAAAHKNAYKDAYAGKNSKFTDSDIDWATTVALFKKIAGIGTEPCPVVYDYAAYIDTLNAGKDVKTKGTFADAGGSKTEEVTEKGSNNNVYKLYLMTQQMNPVTLYNAYFNDNNHENDEDELSEFTEGKFNSTKLVTSVTGISAEEAKKYWNRCTLIPYGSMTEGDQKRDTWAVLGINTSPTIALSAIDGKAKRADINNRLLIFNGKSADTTKDDTNVVSAFETPVFESFNEDVFNAFMCPDKPETVVEVPTSYKACDAIYYMLKDKSAYTNFSKNLSVLEIEPGESFKNAAYWFWYVSRYVPNYTGNTQVTSQSTYEFVGNIDDLNAVFDVIYVGVSTNPSQSDYYKNTMPGDSSSKSYSKGSNVIIEVGQTLNTAFIRPGKKVTTTINAVEVKKALPDPAGDFVMQDDIKRAIQFSSDGTPSLNEAVLGNNISTYSLKLDVTKAASDPGKEVDVYKFVSGSGDSAKTYYFTKLNIVSDGYKTSTGVSIKHEDGDDTISASWKLAISTNASDEDKRVYYRAKDTDEWQSGYIQLNGFANKIDKTEKTDLIWSTTDPDYPAKNYSSGEYVYAGETIKLNGTGSVNISTGNVYLYAHTGKTTTVKATRLGLFSDLNADGSSKNNDDINKFAFSGNDITNAKYKDLINFVEAGYPVIVSNNLLTSTGKFDTKKIDNSSYLYKFLEKLRTSYKSSYYVDNDTTRDSQFITSLRNKTFDLVVNKQPTEYTDKLKHSSITEDKIYINGASDGGNGRINKTDVQFEICIDSTKYGGSYELRLYIDTNADGRFDPTEERLDSLEIVAKETNRSTPYYRLQGNTTYVVTRKISEYSGILPWKLEVIDNDNNLIHDYVKGQCAIKVEEKENIYVLQIIPESSSGYPSTVMFPTDEEIKIALDKRSYSWTTSLAEGVAKADTVEKRNELFNGALRPINGNSASNQETNSDRIKNAGGFCYYTQILSEFNVHFYRMSVDEFIKLVNEGKAPSTFKYDPSKSNRIRLEADTKTYKDENGSCTYFEEVDDHGINMLILGYADCYQDIKDENACAYIEEFISAGNTTLFTHDTTSFVNFNESKFNNVNSGVGDKYWGYYINRYFRELLGMDRYGVMKNRGQESIAKAADTLAPDLPYSLNSNQTGYVTSSSSTLGTRLLTQGMTNVCVGGDGARITKATKTNNGQIVNYPYEIPESLTVASTHAQYYQLDLEADDIVVWYCLTDPGHSYYATKNDVRNNYYIYNRGNITYSGVGHSGGLSEDERKLFVNTMIAAYSAGKLPTEPIITNRDRSVDGSRDFLYVDYDATVEGEEADPFGDEISKDKVKAGTEDVFTKEVHFTLKNYSIILNKQMSVVYYPVVYAPKEGGGTERIVLTDCPLDLKTYRYDDETGVGAEVSTRYYVKSELKSGKWYMKEYANKSEAQTALNTAQAKINNGTDTTTKAVSMVVGGTVESLEQYCVYIPIEDIYYKALSSSMIPANADTAFYRSTDPKGFALDSNNSFEIEIQVIMRYGKQPDKNEPLVGKRGAIIMRRGMFTLD